MGFSDRMKQANPSLTNQNEFPFKWASDYGIVFLDMLNDPQIWEELVIFEGFDRTAPVSIIILDAQGAVVVGFEII